MLRCSRHSKQSPLEVFEGPFTQMLCHKLCLLDIWSKWKLRPTVGYISEEKGPLGIMSFSFSGCGFLGIYHIGVASCLREHAPHFLHEGKLLGASAGAITACCFLCDTCLGKFVFVYISHETSSSRDCKYHLTIANQQQTAFDIASRFAWNNCFVSPFVTCLSCLGLTEKPKSVVLLSLFLLIVWTQTCIFIVGVVMFIAV